MTARVRSEETLNQVLEMSTNDSAVFRRKPRIHGDVLKRKTMQRVTTVEAGYSQGFSPGALAQRE